MKLPRPPASLSAAAGACRPASLAAWLLPLLLLGAMARLLTADSLESLWVKDFTRLPKLFLRGVAARSERGVWQLVSDGAPSDAAGGCMVLMGRCGTLMWWPAAEARLRGASPASASSCCSFLSRGCEAEDACMLLAAALRAACTSSAPGARMSRHWSGAQSWAAWHAFLLPECHREDFWAGHGTC